jgi:Tfp pilus assembly protein PilN
MVAEGLASQPYIHMDIRTPFGETVGEGQVLEALAESLGPRRDRYRLSGWHIQFVEDTNLGSNHRVFADLSDASASAAGLAGMDAGLPLELAVEALGDLVAAEKGEQNFQLLYGGKDFCYSLLYLNGSPFHVLRVNEGAANSAARLRRHRDFAPGSRDSSSGNGRNGSLKTFLLQDDPLRESALIRELHPEAFDLAGSTQPPEAGNAWLLHLGLAHAARQRDFAAHNRVAVAERRRNETIRTRFRFFLAMGATAAVCALMAAAFALAINLSQKRLDALKAQASIYQSQVDSIRSLRKERSRLEASLGDLQPIWHPPMDWSSLLASIAAALPKEAGIDGLAVSRQADGSLELSFRAWVKDWNQVQSIQKKLASEPRFRNVALSEQRKDMQSGAVVFHVTSRLERE